METKEYSISVTWNISDVKSIAPTLTDEQCKQVLDEVLDNHDAQEGINWGVIEIAIENVCAPKVFGIPFIDLINEHPQAKRFSIQKKGEHFGKIFDITPEILERYKDVQMYGLEDKTLNEDMSKNMLCSNYFYDTNGQLMRILF